MPEKVFKRFRNLVEMEFEEFWNRFEAMKLVERDESFTYKDFFKKNYDNFILRELSKYPNGMTDNEMREWFSTIRLGVAIGYVLGEKGHKLGTASGYKLKRNDGS